MKASTTRRGALALALAVTAGALAACSSDDSKAPPVDGGSSSGSLSAYNSIITGGPVADDATIEASPWAKKIKQQGYLKVGGIDSNALFSLKDLETGELVGMDAGMGQLLAHYITGKTDVKSLTQLTQVSVDTRETLLQNNSVDVVLATYSITPERAKKIDFGGPYFSSGDAIMVKKDNTDITSVDDLAGKTVATESNSTAALALKKFAPEAKVVLFKDNEQCVAAVQQGRADAYVLDQSILLANAKTNPAVKVVSQPFTSDPYGIGLSKDSDATAFVNDFLTKIEADGSWAKLWKATLGTAMEGDAPTPPKVGSNATAS